MILSSLKKGFENSTKKQYFLPYLFLNLIFVVSIFTLLSPALKSINLVLMGNYSPRVLASLAVSFLSMGITALIYLLTKIWLDAGLVFSYYKKMKFFKALEKVKEKYFVVLIFVLILAFISAFLTIIFPKQISPFLVLIFDWLLMFSFISLVIKRDTIKLAIQRSIYFTTKNFFKTICFWCFVKLVEFLIIFMPYFLLFSYIFGLTTTPSITKEFNIQMRVSYTGYFALEPITVFSIILVVTFVSTFFEIFVKISKTELFLKISRKRRK